MSPRALLLGVLSLLLTLLTLLGLSAAGGPAGASAERAAPARQAASSDVPRTYDDAVKHFKHADGGVVRTRRFLTPSGNIYCAIKVRHMPRGCEISEGQVKDPAACGGNPASKYVGRIEFRHGRATPICNTDTIRQPGAVTLPYGSKARFPRAGIKCLSESIGVTCISLRLTEGFFLHRGEYVIFNAG
jgi:hypothetical protein